MQADRTLPEPGLPPPPLEFDVPTMLRAQARRIDSMERQLEDGAARMERLEHDLRENTAATRQLVDLFGSFKGGFAVLGVLGKVAKWLSAIGGLAITLYGLLHLGDAPKKP